MTRRRVWRVLVPAGLIGGLLILLILPLTGLQRILFSPGNGVHDGQVSCIECHAAFSSTPGCNNIACHPAVPGTYKTAASYQFHGQVANQECTACHTEHAGRMDNFAGRQFSHELFDAAQRNCQTCHKIPPDSLHNNLGSTTNCAGCHTTTSWQGASFSHSQLSETQLNQCVTCHQRPSDQNHSLFTEQCAVCHQNSAWQAVHFNHSGITKANLNNCAVCHAPPRDNNHQLYTSNCAVCHSETNWRPARFSHTGLSAQGRVSCGVCHHAPGDGHRGVGLNCGRCHTTKSWGDD